MSSLVRASGQAPWARALVDFALGNGWAGGGDGKHVVSENVVRHLEEQGGINAGGKGDGDPSPF